MDFSDDIKSMMDASMTELATSNGIRYASLPEPAKQMCRITMHVAQEYMYVCVADLKNQLIASVEGLDPKLKPGFQLAIRALAETTWGKQAEEFTGEGGTRSV